MFSEDGYRNEKNVFFSKFDFVYRFVFCIAINQMCYKQACQNSLENGHFF